MDKKIIAIMVSLLVIAAVVVAFVMIAAGGGLRSAGGFTKLYDKLSYASTASEGSQYLQLPESWDSGDVKKVSDVIVDITSEERPYSSQTSLHETTLWFVYLGDKWANPYDGHGSRFFVPIAWGDGWLVVNHGLFSITVLSHTNISNKYTAGDVITLESTLEDNRFNMLAFGEWAFPEVS